MAYGLEDLLEEFDPTYSSVEIGGRPLEGSMRLAQPDAPRTPPSTPQVFRENDSLPEPSAPLASADKSFRPEPVRARPMQEQDDEGGGFDWKRALASLFSGDAGVQTIDKLRAAQKAEKRASAKRAEDSKYRASKESRDQGEYDARASERAKQNSAYAAANDPQSPQSQKMRDELSAGLDILGNSMPEQKQALEKLRAKIDGMSALEIQGLQGRLGSVFSLAMNAGKAAAERDIKTQALAGTLDDRKNDNARGWASQSEQERHNRAMENAAATKIDAKVQGNQDKLNEKVESLGNLDEQIGKAIEAKRNVDVGPIATPISKLRQYTPWPDKDFDQLQRTLGTVRNEIKLLKSGKAVTPTEEKGLNEEMANLEQLQDDPTFESKLNGMSELIKGYKKRAVNQYQRRSGGETVDRSNTARTATKSEPSLTPGESTGAENVDPVKAAQIMRAKQIVSNPGDYPPEKVAKAQKWLELNK